MSSLGNFQRRSSSAGEAFFSAPNGEGGLTSGGDNEERQSFPVTTNVLMETAGTWMFVTIPTDPKHMACEKHRCSSRCAAWGD